MYLEIIKCSMTFISIKSFSLNLYNNIVKICSCTIACLIR